MNSGSNGSTAVVTTQVVPQSIPPPNPPLDVAALLQQQEEKLMGRIAQMLERSRAQEATTSVPQTSEKQVPPASQAPPAPAPVQITVQKEEAPPPAPVKVEPPKPEVSDGRLPINWDNIAKVLEQAQIVGPNQAAKMCRIAAKSSYKEDWLEEALLKSESCITPKRVAVWACKAGLVYIIYEGIRYTLRNRANLPGLINWSGDAYEIVDVIPEPSSRGRR